MYFGKCNYIYIFDNEGNLKLKSENTIHYGYSYYGDYYTLSGLGYSENYFYVFVGVDLLMYK